jgi:prepilin-type processing-associated H-X9-DG protein
LALALVTQKVTGAFLFRFRFRKRLLTKFSCPLDNRRHDPPRQVQHANGNTSHVLWQDGHASSLREDALTQAKSDFPEQELAPAP